MDSPSILRVILGLILKYFVLQLSVDDSKLNELNPPPPPKKKLEKGERQMGLTPLKRALESGKFLMTHKVHNLGAL